MNTYAVVLAGGIGKRFSPFKASKPLFSLMGLSLIERTVKKLKNAGFEDVVIVSNERDEKKIKALFNSDEKLKVVVQKTPRGMADALISSEDLIKDGSAFVLNATDQVDQSVFNLAFKKAKEGKSFITGKKVSDYFDGGYLKLEGNRVVEVVEKPGKGNEPSDLVNLVFHFFSSANNFINLLKNTQSGKDDVYEVAFSKLMQEEEVGLLKYEGYWQSTKYPWDILKISSALLKHELEPKDLSKNIHPSAVIDKNVFLGEGVIVYENAVIKGPSYIGQNTIIGNNAFIRESYVGNDSIVGSFSEVARSYVGDSCWLHNNYVGDSVLEENIAFGAGTITGNYRLDEKSIKVSIKEEKVDSGKDHLGALIAKDVRVGINVSLMPGVKIGSNSVIGPAILIQDDVEDNTRVFSSHQNLIKKPFQGKINPR
ncbi:sugar phosphate nucleotidyltransferase [Patescibacteria group bacterium]